MNLQIKFFKRYYLFTILTYPFRKIKNIILELPIIFLIFLPDKTKYNIAKLILINHPVVKYFKNIEIDKTVMLISNNIHTRHKRIADGIILNNWEPIIVSVIKPENSVDYKYFNAKNRFQLYLIFILFPGKLVHYFAAIGSEAFYFTKLKNNFIILDIYDTVSGIQNADPILKYREKYSIQHSKAICHRDLRIKYLKNSYNYKLPNYNILIPDFIDKISVSREKNNHEIHVVSVGSIGVEGDDDMIYRISKILCDQKIHVHIFEPRFTFNEPKTRMYKNLSETNSFFHIEKPLYGNAFKEKLSTYDFGLNIYEPFLFNEIPKQYTIDYLRGCGSSRLSDYIELGLGTIVTPGFEFQTFLAKRYSSKCVLADDVFLDNPLKILESKLHRNNNINIKFMSKENVSRRLHIFYSKILQN